MYLADYHTHTKFSPDARHPMTEMAEAAIAMGLQEICFTDHVEPLVWGGTELRGLYDWSLLKEDFAKVQADVGDRIQLRLGIELGDAQWAPDHIDRLLQGAPELDFVIGSIHLMSRRFGGEDLYYFSPEDDVQARAGLADYLEQVQLMAEYGRFNVLGHLTLPLRYLNENKGFHLTFDGFEAEIESILKTLIANGCGIELNTNRGNTPLPDAKWLRMYRELGGEIITLGTDSHDPSYVGRAIRERQELLRQCGFKRFCTFEKRQPIWHEL